MADVETTQQLLAACEMIGEFKPRKEELIRRRQWGDINFEMIVGEIETVFWFAEEMKNLPVNIIPNGIVTNATQRLTNIHGILAEIDRFSLSGQPEAARDDISNRLKGELENAISHIGLWLPLLALRAGEIENWAGRMRNINAEATATMEETRSRIEADLKEIEEIKQAARAAAGEAGAAEFTREFRDEAGAVETRGRWWLIPTAAFGAAALGMAGLIILGLLGEPPSNAWEAVYNTGGRFIAIAVLFYAAAWSGRIVLANMHLASVNKHRAISLQTLQAFLKSAEDPVARDAVVLEAARAVYENVPSGYIGRHTSQPGGNSRILEIIKNANRGVAEPGPGV